MRPSMLRLLSLFFLLMGVVQIQLNAQCFNGIISGHTKTTYNLCDAAVTLTGETEFFGDIDAPIDPVFSISPNSGSGFTDNGDGTASFNPSGVGFGTFTITFDFDSGLDCKELGVVVFTVLDIESIAIEIEGIACEGSTLNLATSETFTNISSHSWTGPNGFTSPFTFPTIEDASSLNSGTYFVTVTYSTGCTAVANRNITINPSPSIQVNSNNPSCVGETLNLSSTGTGGTYSWTGPDNFSSTNASVNISNLTIANAGTYTLVFTAASGCTTSESATVSLATLPEPTISSSGPFCAGDAELTLEDNGAATYTYNWLNENSGTTYQGKTVTIANPVESDGGNYDVTVTNSDGCTVVENINVVYNGEIPQLAITGQSNVCQGNNIILSETGDGGMNHVWTGPNGFESNGTNVQIDNATNLNAGIYTVVADNNNGCTAEITIDISINPLPNIALSSSDTEPCEGETIQFTENGGDLVEWNWSGPDDFTATLQNPSISNIGLDATGTYTLQGTDANACAAESTIDLTVQMVFNSGTGRNVQICTGSILDLTNLLENQDPGGIFIDENGAGTLDGSILETANLTSGDYRFTYTLAETSRCISSTTVLVRVQELLTAGEDVSLTECQNASIDLVNALSGADEGGTFIDEGNSGGLNGSTFNSAGLSSGIYDIIYRVGVGGVCPVDEAVITIDLATLPEVPQFPELVYCGGEALTITATEGETYQWSNGATSQTISVNPLTSTNYGVTVTNSTSCSVSGVANVQVGTLGALNLANDATICEGETYQLNAAGGTIYQWTPTTNLSNPTLSNPVANPTENTTYQVLVSNELGCTASGAVSVTVNESAEVPILESQAICEGETVTLSATQGTVYAWSNGAATQTISVIPLESTNYSVTVSNDFNCSRSAAATITVNPIPVLEVTNNSTICRGSSLQLTASGATTYNWSPAVGLSNTTIANPIANPTENTTYEVLASNDFGCTANGAVSVIVNESPEVPVLESQAICEGETVTLSATQGTLYAWSNGAAVQTIAVNPLESTNYSVTVTNDFNCSRSAAATITVNPIPVLEVTNNSSICRGSSLQLTASGATTYNWSPAVGLSNTTIANPIANPTENTTYLVAAESAEGCSDTASVSIDINDLPTLQVGADVSICSQEGTTLQATGVGTFQWSPVTGLDNPTSGTPFANPEASTDYSVILTDENGCTASGQLAVEVRALPVINLGENQAICEGDQIELVASGGGTYQWEAAENINPTSPNQIVSPTQLTTYKVQVTGENNCLAEAEITISVNSNPIADAGSDQSTCVGIAAELVASGGGTYQWSDNSTGSAISVAPEENTTYTVTVTNTEGCTDTDEVLVSVAEDFEVSVSPDTFYCLGQSAQLNAAGGASYDWSPAIGLNETNIANPVASPVATTLYEVVIKDDMGCIVKRTVEVEVKQVEGFSLTENQDLCEGKSVTLTATGGINYNWMPTFAFNDPNLSSQQLSPLNTATYQVEVIDEFGCTISDSVSVTIRPIPTVTAAALTEICEGETLNLEGTGEGVSEWLWQATNFSAEEQNPILENIQNNQSGEYTLTGTTEFGCTATHKINIQVNAQPTINIDAPEVICENFPLILIENGGADLTSWDWSNDEGLTFSQANWDLGLAQTSFSSTYQLVVSDANGCTNSATKSILVNQAPNAGTDVAVAACQGEIVDIANLLVDSDPNGVFEPGLGLGELNGTIINTQNLEEGDYTLSYVVTTEACPSDEAIIALQIETTKSAGLDNSLQACQGLQVELKDLLQEADDGGVFEISMNMEALNGSVLSTEILPPGNYQIEYRIGIGSTCGEDKALFSVELADQVKAGIDVQTDLCQVGTFDLATILENATMGGDFIDLSQSNALNGSILSAENLPIGQYLFEYKIQSSNECPSDSAMIEVNIKDILTAGMDNEKTFCTGPAIALSDLLIEADAGGIFNPLGAPPPDFADDVIASAGLSSNTFSFEYKVGGIVGCPEDIATITVNLNQSPMVELMVSDTFFCLGDSVVLKAVTTGGTGALTFQWQTPTGSLSNSTITALDAGTYQAIARDINNCEATATTLLTSNSELAIEIEGKAEVCQNEDLVLQVSSNEQELDYSWRLPDGTLINDSILVLDANQVISGEYVLQITDEFNCMQEVSQMVTISPGEFFRSNFLTANFACVGDSLHFIEIAETELSAGASYEWDFGDGQNSTERDPVHSFQSPGLYPVSIKINDQNCGNESIEKEINIVSCRKLITGGRFFKYLNLYPNPAIKNSKLEIELEKEEEMLMTVTDLNGRLVSEKMLSGGKFFIEDIHIENAGIYFIYLKSVSGRSVLKLVVNE